MKLSDKITSAEQLRQVDDPPSARQLIHSRASSFANDNEPWYPNYVCNTLGSLGCESSDRIPTHAWWFAREIYRQRFGIYAEPTQVLRAMWNHRSLFQYFPHISKDDPTKIAFTASVEDGLRDKQTRITLGRFLRKYAPLISDTDIATMEANHRSELNPDVRLHAFETDMAEVLKAYQTLQSCMSYAADRYAGGRSPLYAYATPGFHLAVLYRADTAVARCITWINPKNAQDKRMVRCYGDPGLEKTLLRQGFVYKAFDGAYLHTTKLSNERITCPYVDGVQGVRESDETNYAGIWDGEDKLYIITKRQQSRLGSDTPTCDIRTTEGAISASAAKIVDTCVVTGQTINRLTDAYTPNVYVGGNAGIAVPEAVSAWRQAYIGGSLLYRVSPETPVFSQRGVDYVDDEPTRERLGYRRLSQELYPGNDNAWHDALVETTDGYALSEDCATLVSNGDGCFSGATLHKSRIPPNSVRCTRIGTRRVYAAPDVTTAVTTSGRRVIPGHHAVKKTWDGKWIYTRHARGVCVLTSHVYIEAGAAETSVRLTEVPARIARIIDAQMSLSSLNAIEKSVFYHAYRTPGSYGSCYGGLRCSSPAAFDLSAVDALLASPPEQDTPEQAFRRHHTQLLLDAIQAAWIRNHPEPATQSAEQPAEEIAA